MGIMRGIMLGLMMLPGLVGLALAQGGGAGKVDARAVAELERAEALYAQDGNTQEAVKLALAQVEAFQKTEDYDHLVDCLFLIGNCYYELGTWDKAEQFMKMANELGWRYFPDQMGTGALKVIGESQFQQDKHAEALKTFQERVSKLKAQGAELDQAELAGALFDVAGVLINLGRPAEALPQLEAALQANTAAAAALARPDSGAAQEDRDANKVDRAEIIYHMAIAYYAQDKFADCRPRLVDALELFNEVHSSRRVDLADRLVAVLDDLVVVSEKLGEPAVADGYRAQRDKLNQ